MVWQIRHGLIKTQSHGPGTSPSTSQRASCHPNHLHYNAETVTVPWVYTLSHARDIECVKGMMDDPASLGSTVVSYRIRLVSCTHGMAQLTPHDPEQECTYFPSRFSGCCRGGTCGKRIDCCSGMQIANLLSPSGVVQHPAVFPRNYDHHVCNDASTTYLHACYHNANCLTRPSMVTVAVVLRSR